MRQLTLFGWGILTLSLASFWTLPAQKVVAHVRDINAKQIVPGAVSQSGANRDNDAIPGSESLQNSFLLNGADAVDYRARQEKQERRRAWLAALLTFGALPAFAQAETGQIVDRSPSRQE